MTAPAGIQDIASWTPPAGIAKAPAGVVTGADLRIAAVQRPRRRHVIAALDCTRCGELGLIPADLCGATITPGWHQLAC